MGDSHRGRALLRMLAAEVFRKCKGTLQMPGFTSTMLAMFDVGPRMARCLSQAVGREHVVIDVTGHSGHPNNVKGAHLPGCQGSATHVPVVTLEDQSRCVIHRCYRRNVLDQRRLIIADLSNDAVIAAAIETAALSGDRKVRAGGSSGRVLHRLKGVACPVGRICKNDRETHLFEGMDIVKMSIGIVSLDQLCPVIKVNPHIHVFQIVLSVVEDLSEDVTIGTAGSSR